jgi:hypothetical protein
MFGDSNSSHLLKINIEFRVLVNANIFMSGGADESIVSYEITVRRLV